MKTKYLLVIIACVLGVQYLNAQCEDSTEISNWIHQNAVKIEKNSSSTGELNMLKEIVDDASVVAFGESRHDIHEQFEIKSRYIKYLISELGFRTVLLESSLPYTERLNEYLVNDKGDLSELMDGMPDAGLWNTEEIFDLLQWINQFNSAPERKDKVQFHGIDVVTPNYALNEVFEYLSVVDSLSYQSVIKLCFVQDLIHDHDWPRTMQNYFGLSELKKDSLTDNYAQLNKLISTHKDEYIQNSSRHQYEWILHLSKSLINSNKMFCSTDRLEIGMTRDSAMAANVFWFTKGDSSLNKTIIWAHNVHIVKSKFKMTGFNQEISGMGYLLNQEFGGDMVAIGASYDGVSSEFEPSSNIPSDLCGIDKRISDLGIGDCLLNLNKETESSAITDWLNSESILLGQGFEMTFQLRKGYDALFFTQNVTKTYTR